MKITINDRELELADGTTLGQVLRDNSIPSAGTAVAVNGSVVPKSAYKERVLADGDSIIIIKAFYGG